MRIASVERPCSVVRIPSKRIIYDWVYAERLFKHYKDMTHSFGLKLGSYIYRHKNLALRGCYSVEVITRIRLGSFCNRPLLRNLASDTQGFLISISRLFWYLLSLLTTISGNHVSTSRQPYSSRSTGCTIGNISAAEQWPMVEIYGPVRHPLQEPN